MTPNKWIISVPFGFETGGPEALHQLCHTLRENNQTAFVFPQKGTENNARVKEYEKYDAPEIRFYNRSDIIVIPEVTPRLISKTEKSILWWLSVDNSPLITGSKFNKPNKILDRRFYKKFYSESTFHVTQSLYAYNFLRNQVNLEATMLTDWVSTPKINLQASRSKYVAVNGNKGLDKYEKLRNLMPEIEFRVVKNMTKKDAMELIANSELYLDLGNQPGKDRLPREAALLNVPVLILEAGSAFGSNDFQLSHEYKFQWNNLEDLKRKIWFILENKPKATKDQGIFKKNIEIERETFKNEVKDLIQRVTNE